MNLEETQKVNLLAKTLQMQGIACSSLEAVDKDNKIINAAKSKSIEEDQLRLLEKKFKFLLEENNNKVINEINTLKGSMNYLISALNSIKGEITQHREGIIKKHEVSTKPGKVEAQEKKEYSHPRQGNYSPEDVSIGKFFYFGRK